MPKYVDPTRLQKLAKLQADRARMRWADKQVQMRRRTAQQLQSAGKYWGYNADMERHQIQLDDERIILADPLTNAGLAAGDRVVVSQAGGWKFKAMPR
jgi:hypothetical protein